jgi:NDP-sugar pyrophosphorylase family protein
MRAMILAAGYGTRLWPLTIDRAKPAIPFMGRPLVGYVAEYLAQFGCREIAVNLHHQAESVRAALGAGTSFGVRLQYFDEPEILGTSGALDNAREFLARDTFIVVNGKIATNINLREALATHRRARALATLVLRRNVERERYSVVHVRDGLVERFGGFPAPASDKVRDANSVPPTSVGVAEINDQRSAISDQQLTSDEQQPTSSEQQSAIHNPQSAIETPLMFTGIHILEPRIFDFIPRGIFSDTVTDVYQPAMRAGERIAAHIATGYWYELSTVRRYLDTSLALMRRAGRDVELGPRSIIEPDADVRDAVLWEAAHVAAGAHVRRAILGAGVRVLAGETIENAAVVRAELVRATEQPAKGLTGTIQGANFVAPLAQ